MTATSLEKLESTVRLNQAGKSVANFPRPKLPGDLGEYVSRVAVNGQQEHMSRLIRALARLGVNITPKEE